ncbi:hypothetical protein [Streptomyces sp. NPDC018833]|uniref:hypothetical protein n=1 Tax=Streptomyces sp. NPDC018833 TaxID=3365053 RepID=UPI00378E023D
MNDWVEKLRGRLGGGESVPRFDPASGGIEARSLFRKKLRVGAAQGLLGVRRPVVDEARSAPVWQRVEVLSGAYEVAP